MTEYWLNAVNALCWIAFLLSLITSVTAFILIVIGSNARSDNAVKSDIWVSGVLRQQDGYKFTAVTIALWLTVAFLPCEHHPKTCHEDTNKFHNCRG